MFEQSDSEATIECPKCGGAVAVKPVTVLRAGEPAVLELFRGDLNSVLCPNCEIRFFLDVPLVFRDDDKQCLIYFMPLANPRNWRTAEREMAEIVAHIFDAEITAEDRALPQCRLTVTRKSFIEKIALHLHELDDRVIEYIKYQLYQNKEQKIDPIRHELLYDFSRELPDALPLIVFDRESGQASAATHIPLDLYHEIKSSLDTDIALQQELDELFPGFFVSVERLL